jgi:DNA-binding NarL/FixJ family response regulator
LIQSNVLGVRRDGALMETREKRTVGIGEPAREMLEPRRHSRRPELHNGRAILSETHWEITRRRLGLSVREMELVQHIFDGKKLLRIAQDMNLALGTVKTYSQRVHRKLRVSDQRELILAILEEHLRRKAHAPDRFAVQST